MRIQQHPLRVHQVEKVHILHYFYVSYFVGCMLPIEPTKKYGLKKSHDYSNFVYGYDYIMDLTNNFLKII